MGGHFAAMPYLKNPKFDPNFHVYFTKEWYEALHVSVRNFFSEVFNGTHILHISVVMFDGFDIVAYLTAWHISLAVRFILISWKPCHSE